MSPVERLYREIATPKPSQPEPAQAAETKAELTRADVDSIIQRKRAASLQELQFIIDNAKR